MKSIFELTRLVLLSQLSQDKKIKLIKLLDNESQVTDSERWLIGELLDATDRSHEKKVPGLDEDIREEFNQM